MRAHRTPRRPHEQNESDESDSVNGPKVTAESWFDLNESTEKAERQPQQPEHTPAPGVRRPGALAALIRALAGHATDAL
jgi:hypothetical protein